MSKKHSFREKMNYHSRRACNPYEYRLDEKSPKTAYSEGFVSGGEYGHGLANEANWWRGRGRKQAGAYALGVAAGKKARRRG